MNFNIEETKYDRQLKNFVHDCTTEETFSYVSQNHTASEKFLAGEYLMLKSEIYSFLQNYFTRMNGLYNFSKINLKLQENLNNITNRVAYNAEYFYNWGLHLKVKYYGALRENNFLHDDVHTLRKNFANDRCNNLYKKILAALPRSFNPISENYADANDVTCLFHNVKNATQTMVTYSSKLNNDYTCHINIFEGMDILQDIINATIKYCSFDECMVPLKQHAPTFDENNCKRFDLFKVPELRILTKIKLTENFNLSLNAISKVNEIFESGKANNTTISNALKNFNEEVKPMLSLTEYSEITNFTKMSKENLINYIALNNAATANALNNMPVANFGMPEAKEQVLKYAKFLHFNDVRKFNN